jgi:endonuclease I
MKKLFFTTIALICLGTTAMAQAVLPTSWSFATTTLPTGWSTSGTDYYTASGNTPPAMKFDGTGDFLTINFTSSPGNLTYFIAGNSFAGGTFTVQESDLGSTWTTVHTYTTLPAGTYVQMTDALMSTTRYVRFFYTQKVTGNVGLDDVSISVGAATPEQEINVKQGTTTIPNNGTYAMSSAVNATTSTTFTIENLGTANTLNISNAQISGPNASEFVVSAFPATVGAASTGNLVIDFTPTASGTRNATLTISSNDTDEASYVINLIGYGGGSATEPAAQPTALTFSNVKTYRFNASFTPSSPAPQGYLVLRKKGSAITGVPADGTVYQRGDNVGDAQVVMSGAATSFTPNHIVASETYYFAVYAYNGDGTFRNYLTTAPLASSVTTPATMMPANEYNGISTASASFVADLHAHVNQHDMQFYSNYANLMIRNFVARDTTMNRRVVTCVYSGENKIYTEPFDFSSLGYSREHTYPHSWMPTNPAQDLPEYNDYHHLFPVNQNNANALRSNYPFGEVVTVTQEFLDCKFGLDANNHLVFEPRDAHKGDAARAMMYEAIAYTTVAGNNWGLPDPISSSIQYGQDQAILKQWHFQDPPSQLEISRNDYLDSLQDNRNPFIDNPNYACFVNFYNMSYESAGCFASVEEKLSANFMVFPNPATEVLNLNVDATTISAYEITDMQGRAVLKGDAKDETIVSINVADLKAGTYLVRATTPYGVAQKSIVVN